MRSFARIVATILLAASVAGATGVRVPAGMRCACCADPGTWSEVARRITPEEFAELGRLSFGSMATTFVTPAGLDGIRGITSPSDQYRVVHRGRTRDWRLELSGPNGSRGDLQFTIPDRGTFFMTDLRGDGTAAPGGPVLYKELRVRGPLGGTGSFRSGTFNFVLQGRGNSCYHADDFTTWILQVRGNGIAYAIFGSLNPPRPR
jgi:hypothetical protein